MADALGMLVKLVVGILSSEAFMLLFIVFVFLIIAGWLGYLYLCGRG